MTKTQELLWRRNQMSQTQTEMYHKREKKVLFEFHHNHHERYSRTFALRPLCWAAVFFLRTESPITCPTTIARTWILWESNGFSFQTKQTSTPRQIPGQERLYWSPSLSSRPQAPHGPIAWWDIRARAASFRVKGLLVCSVNKTFYKPVGRKREVLL